MAGEILLKRQQPDEAIPFLKRALKTDPNHVRAHASLGHAYLSTGEDTRAMPHLKSALESDRDGSLHYQLARAYQRAGEHEPATQMLRKYQELQKAVETEKALFQNEIKITPP